MSDVFLLGAGFSKSASGGMSLQMPLLGELSLEIKDKMCLPSFLTDSSDDLEQWLSYLGQPHPWLREQDNLRNQALALDIIEQVGTVIGGRERLVIENECPAWLEELTEFWHRNKSGVVSLNYDTLVERVASTIVVKETGGTKYYLDSANLYPVDLTLSTRRNAMVLGSSEVESFSLCKLHGSINWYYSGAAESTGEVIYYREVDGWGTGPSKEPRLEIRSREQEAVSDKVPLIVPPTIEKSRFFRHESLRRTWAHAATLLSEANRVFAVGYSLPITDLAFRQFLLAGSKEEQEEFYVINTDRSATTHYCQMLGQAFEINDSYVGDGAVERFVEDVCARTN
ncbi:MAG: hypothetical protein OXG37_12925 [Actinomycetia bacterium]|nr:hypothetical protein [Actinomycetes bacterium]